MVTRVSTHPTKAEEFIEEFNDRRAREGLVEPTVTIELSPENREFVSFDKIWVAPDQRRRGHFQRSVTLLTNLADEVGMRLYTIPLALRPEQKGEKKGAPTKKLRALYLERGFYDDPDAPGTQLRRDPATDDCK